MNRGTDLSHIYSLRQDFTVIALTGRTGSGCTTVAKQISRGFDESYPKPTEKDFDQQHNSYRKYHIVYDYARQNFGGYLLLTYRDVLTMILLKYPLQDFIEFLFSPQVTNAVKGLKEKVFKHHAMDVNREGYNPDQSVIDDLFLHKINEDFTKEKLNLESLAEDFAKFGKAFNQIDFIDVRKNLDEAEKLFDVFFSPEYKLFSELIHKSLKSVSPVKHNIVLQQITNNIRRSNNPFKPKDTDATNIFAIADQINVIIKAVRSVNDKATTKTPTKVIIDSLRNPFEIMFFRQRYSAFYIIAVNRQTEHAETELKNDYKGHYPVLREVLEEEYKGGKGKEFYKQYVRSCIEKADIHITFRTKEETDVLNKSRKDNTSPYFSWQMQILKYLALIEHPGLITPSPEERCMQMAYTAKYNSGCISRQVGAAITDESYSLKAIGWNNTPEGQVPCLLRKAEVLMNASKESIEEQTLLEHELRAYSEANTKAPEELVKKLNVDLQAFTPFEKSDEKFRLALQSNYVQQVADNRDLLNGRNVCICFKSLHNSCYDGKNQVHTRSLHAEESAFLQVTKYGGTAIKDGKLFTTASPCELCAKKAYQLGIKVIYYVDPYPGISEKQILNTGKNPPEVRLFNGAIGNAYHWLYEPFMAYKDELALILGNDVKDKLTQMEDDMTALRKRVKELEKENAAR
jgi:deoxycytidylate deaminase